MTGNQLQFKDVQTLRNSDRAKWRGLSSDALPLWLSELDCEVPRLALEEAATKILGLNYAYGRQAGLPEVRQAIAAFESRARNLFIRPEEVRIVAGVKSTIQAILAELTRSGGGLLVVGDPAYRALFENLVGHQVEINVIPLRRGVIALQTALLNSWRPSVAAMFVVNPQSPTGELITREEIDCLGMFACEKDMIIVSDEIYSNLVYDGEFESIATRDRHVRERTIVISGLGKVLALNGLRLGHLIHQGNLFERFPWLNHNVWTLPSIVDQQVLLACLKHAQWWLHEVREYMRSITIFATQALGDIPEISLRRGQAGLSLWIELPPHLNASTVVEFLAREQKVVCTSPGRFLVNRAKAFD